MGKKIFALFVSIVFLLMPVMCPKTVFADDGGKVIEPGKHLTGTIDSNNKEATYKLVLTKSAIVYLNINSHVNKADFSLTNSQGQVIASTHYNSPYPSDSWNVTKGLPAGSYFVKVSQVGDYTGIYYIDETQDEVSDDIPDLCGTIDTAKEINLNSNFTTMFKWQQDENYYKLNITKPGRLNMDAISYNNNYAFSLFKIVEGNQHEIFNYYVQSGLNDKPKDNNYYVDLLPGTYYIEARVISVQTHYIIKTDFTEAQDDDVYPNNTIDTAQPLNLSSQIFNGFLSDDCVTHIYKFIMPEDGELSLNVQSQISHGVVQIIDEKDVTYFKASDISPMTVNQKVKLNKGNYYLGITTIDTDNVTGAYTLSISSSAADSYIENEVKNTVSTALTKKNFASFQIAYGTIMQYYSNNLAMRDKYLSQIAGLYNVVNTPDVSTVREEMIKLAQNRDLGAYNKIVYELVNNIKDDENKQYVLGEITRWGRQYVWTPAVSHAVDAVNQAWKDKTAASKQAAIDAIAKVESQASKDYLTGQLSGI